jgi:type II secretory ATPase GspE/PulE/Tfp pilus assembly ATPase PilB-like protein
MLRQAPNIILVGEIRDRETAEIAVQAALTGHLVFSTLHTNDSPSAITRLCDMGVKPFLVAASVQAVLAQRLVRVVCPHCRQQYEPGESELRSIGSMPPRSAPARRSTARSAASAASRPATAGGSGCSS